MPLRGVVLHPCATASELPDLAQWLSLLSMVRPTRESEGAPKQTGERGMMRKTLLTMAGAAALSVSSVATAQETTAYFSMIVTHKITREPHEFIFAVTNPDVINAMREQLSSSNPPAERHVIGVIETTRVEYNQPWPFHFRPETVALFRMQTEQCDADPFTVEDNLALVGSERNGKAFLKDHIWCPWDSRIVREVKAP